jgi:hypothetical protein
MAGTLVVHPGALGDVLLAIPALRAVRGAVRRTHPGHDVLIAAQSHIGALLEALGEVDGCVRFDALRLDVLFAEDPVVSPSRVLHDAERVVCWYGARDPAFVRRLRGIVPDAVVAPSVPEAGTVWEHLVATAGQLGVDAAGGERGALADGLAHPGRRVPVHVPPTLLERGRRALEQAGWDGETSLVVVHPGASGPRKRWPVDRFVDVLDPLPHGLAIVVHEGPTDRDAVRGVVRGLHRPVMRLDNPSLPVLAGVLVHAASYLGNDSGVSHLAAAVGVPSVVLFRSELMRWVPWAARVEIVPVREDEPGEAAAAGTALMRALAAPVCRRD